VPLLSDDMAFWAGISARVSSLEPLFSWGAFLGGVVWDALTLDRIDRPGSQLTLVVLWGVVVTCLLLIVLVRSEGKWAERLRWAAALGAQFGLGGLFSALSIFFVRSASWGSSALFVFIIVALLVANEFFREHYRNPVPLFTMWSIATSALALLVIPTVVGAVSQTTTIAALGSAAALGLSVGWVIARLRSSATGGMGVIAVGVPFVLFGLYAANLIPPVPLVAKEVGIYHHLWRDEAGYHLVRYDQGWRNWVWRETSDELVSVADAPVYCFSAVFAPEGVRTTIYHHWQKQEDASGAWITHSRLAIPLTGGREGGYRGYSWVRQLDPGVWRCRVEDERGRSLGSAEVTVREDPIDAREEVILR